MASFGQIIKIENEKPDGAMPPGESGGGVSCRGGALRTTRLTRAAKMAAVHTAATSAAATGEMPVPVQRTNVRCPSGCFA